MENEVATLLNAVTDGETIDFEPQSRMEEYLKSCINKTGTEGLPTPQSRVDALLYILAEKIAEGGSSGSSTGGSNGDYPIITMTGLNVGSVIIQYKGEPITDAELMELSKHNFIVVYFVEQQCASTYYTESFPMFYWYDGDYGRGALSDPIHVNHRAVSGTIEYNGKTYETWSEF